MVLKNRKYKILENLGNLGEMIGWEARIRTLIA
jgi:hypothetical protein